jgi:hypothetical protein
MYPAVANAAVVLMHILYVALVAAVLHMDIVDNTVLVAAVADAVYNVSAVVIVPVLANAPSRLYNCAMSYS